MTHLANDTSGHAPGNSLLSESLRRFCNNRFALGCFLFLMLLMMLCFLASFIAPYSYESQSLALGASFISKAHPLGTDLLGRDLLTRLLYGGKVSFMVGICATFVSVVIGVCWGSIAAWRGGRTDAVMMRIVDILYAFPFTIFVIILMVYFERSMLLLFAAIGAVEWLTMARIVRGQVLSLRHAEFVEAAAGLGLPSFVVIVKHILPNIVSPVIVYTTLTIPSVMLLEAFLSFLGLGVQPPASSWGIIIREGAASMESYPWLIIFPGIVLSATLLAFNIVGDALRDALDPQSGRN